LLLANRSLWFDDAHKMIPQIPDFQSDPVEQWLSHVMTWSVLISIVLVLYGLYRVRSHRHGNAVTRLVLIICIVGLPLFSVSSGMVLVFVRAERVEFCGSCHRALSSYVTDMHSRDSEGLAAIHYRYRYIASNQCFECHTSYGLFGSLKAKVNGVRQVLHYYSGSFEAPITMWKPYSNEECLKCHAESARWQAVEAHADTDQLRAILTDDTSCMECHESGHPDATVSAGGALP
jgi:nitrate/TMAO reductase-like tetraheme cytochrome c subunit